MQIGLDSIVTCRFDDLAILHLLRGTVWPQIQGRPLKLACVSRTLPTIHSWSGERRETTVGNLDKRVQHANRASHLLRVEFGAASIDII